MKNCARTFVFFFTSPILVRLRTLVVALLGLVLATGAGGCRKQRGCLEARDDRYDPAAEKHDPDLCDPEGTVEKFCGTWWVTTQLIISGTDTNWLSGHQMILGKTERPYGFYSKNLINVPNVFSNTGVGEVRRDTFYITHYRSYTGTPYYWRNYGYLQGDTLYYMEENSDKKIITICKAYRLWK